MIPALSSDFKEHSALTVAATSTTAFSGETSVRKKIPESPRENFLYVFYSFPSRFIFYLGPQMSTKKLKKIVPDKREQLFSVLSDAN